LSTATVNRRHGLALLAALFLTPVLARAGEVQVVDAKASCGSGGCSFSATLLHEDTGWDHYADHWRVLTPDGDEIARRVLYHPHVDEQPFTRSLGGVNVPQGIDKVIIEGHDKVHGYGGQRFTVELP
jgi:hypothetical protein